MAKSLVIVESPAKAKTINKYLGKDFIVKSSVGHIRDLPTNAAAAAKLKDKNKPEKKISLKGKSEEEKEEIRQQKVYERMAVFPEDGWRATYTILPGKEKVLKELKEHAKDAPIIYLATDMDREGEAIAWHLREAIGGDLSRYKRVVFTEITKPAIKKAFESPGEIKMNRVHAQQARRFLDRVVGFMLSPLLWARVARGLSAGRVQSVAVRIVSEREREISAFKPDEYWEVHLDVSSKDAKPPKEGEENPDFFRMAVLKKAGKAYKPVNEAQALDAKKVFESQPLAIDRIETKPTSSKPSAPFITSTLQQAASTRLSFGVKKTMMLAQRLYEAGYITYMRTDSTNISKDTVEGCRDYISGKYGKKYLPESPIVYKGKKNAQEAHEAIRPSDWTVEPAMIVDKVERDQQRLYDLIWRQFVSCQMVPAKFDSTSIFVKSGDYEAKVRGKVLTFDGYQKVQKPVLRVGDGDWVLPRVKEGDELKLLKADPTQHFTKPPPRYSEASLVKELEKRGIGRPSTYASIISTIQDRGYVAAKNRRFYCLKMGEIVTDRLVESFDDLMEYSFTANMEEKLDQIAEGEAKWKSVLDDFFGDFQSKVNSAKETMRSNDPTLTDVNCPKCEKPMQIRTGRTGTFLSCSGYNLPPKERCKETLNLELADEFADISLDDDEGNVEEIRSKSRCKKCDFTMDQYIVDEERKIHVCSNNPDCDGYKIETGKFVVKGYEGPVIECDKCTKDMQLKNGRFGKYFGCTAYPDCKNTRKLLRSGEAAPPKVDPIPMPELLCEKSDGYFILRDGAAGIFLASSAFPKSRETRKPLVEDLVRHKKELDPKYAYIADAPVKDPDGNKAIVRFSRKNKEHIISSENKEGKATKWVLNYVKDKWKLAPPPEKKKKAAKEK